MNTIDPEETIGAKLVKGSAWMVALRWSIRFVGLINRYILVRLLNPAGLGGLIFFFTSLLLWFLSGRPDAPEKFVWNIVSSKRPRP